MTDYETPCKHGYWRECSECDVQAAIDAALESVKEYLESAIQHRIISGDLYMVGRNDAFRDAAGFIESRIGTNPLAEAQARIAELEFEIRKLETALEIARGDKVDLTAQLAEARKDVERYERVIKLSVEDLALSADPFDSACSRLRAAMKEQSE